MEVIILPDSKAASRLAAGMIADLIRKKSNCVLGLATGSTPLGIYRELVSMHNMEGLDFSEVTSFNLDEYVGLSPEHHASYHRFMQENLFNHINMPKDHVHIPDGLATDIPSYCQSYEEAIYQAGGIDLQLLGIGTDGHLGFNEPTSSLTSRTRIKTLDRQTILDNQRFFQPGESVPSHVITMGIGTILDAKTCLLIAFGESKAEAVAGMVEGPVAAILPASALQLHQKAIIILDEAAASKLAKREYYQWVYDHKPDWQKVGQS